MLFGNHFEMALFSEICLVLYHLIAVGQLGLLYFKSFAAFPQPAVSMDQFFSCVSVLLSFLPIFCSIGNKNYSILNV